MNRRAFMRRMASAALAGMLGSRLSWGEVVPSGDAFDGMEAFGEMLEADMVAARILSARTAFIKFLPVTDEWFADDVYHPSHAPILPGYLRGAEDRP